VYDRERNGWKTGTGPDVQDALGVWREERGARERIEEAIPNNLFRCPEPGEVHVWGPPEEFFAIGPEGGDLPCAQRDRKPGDTADEELVEGRPRIWFGHALEVRQGSRRPVGPLVLKDEPFRG
jgi:hypothetical protein